MTENLPAAESAAALPLLAAPAPPAEGELVLHQSVAPDGDRPWWLTQAPIPRTDKPWPRRATGSPHRVKLAHACLRRFQWRYRDKRPDPSGPEAIVGKLVHGTYEDAGVRRLMRGNGGNAPPVVSVEELLFLLEHQPKQFYSERDDSAGHVTGPMIEEAAQILRDAGPLNLRNLHAAELSFTLQVSLGLVIGGRIDRIDLAAADGRPVYDGKPYKVSVIDYKTTQQIPDEYDLWHDAQAGLYLVWARANWPQAEVIEFLLVNARHGGKPRRIVWTRELEDFHMRYARSAYELWSAGIDRATAGDHCGYCPYRDGDEKYPKCQAYHAELEKSKYLEQHPGGIDALPLPKLLREYRSSAVAEEMHKDRKSELKGAILEKLGDQTKYRWGDLLAYTSQDTERSFDQPGLLITGLAEIAGVKWEALAPALLDVKLGRLDKWVEGIEDEERRKKAEAVVERYISAFKKPPKLTVRRTGSMF